MSILLDDEHDEDDPYSLDGEVMTRGFYVWSKASLHVLSRRMNVDAIYFTAAGDIHRGNDTFHVCEVLVNIVSLSYFITATIQFLNCLFTGFSQKCGCGKVTFGGCDNGF